MNIEQAKKLVKEHKKELLKELYFQTNQFEKIMSKLINQTPTGEFRNDLTYLNILFHSISEKYNEIYE